MPTVDITVWGEKMRLTSDEDAVFIASVADYLNQRMKEVETGDPAQLNTRTIALRTAYLIAAEFLKLQNEVGEIGLTLERIDKTFAAISAGE